MIEPPGNRAAHPEQSVYDAVGGTPFFVDLAERFYAGVAEDASLLPMYPNPQDLTTAKDNLAQFLVQYWGGPADYSATRGHPRLRMRHGPFRIGSAERDAWMKHMTAAVMAAPDLEPVIQQRFLDYFANAADHLINKRS